ncbi:hypothetical protein OIU79_001973 [Salix purpurea]|uniref:Uncharacterized protein n=1 Tax=Salix purpurea TaxID=77065 RepID=A0A9Q0UR38_SALPP|nr:hypothetical protein OIU79_001973 [Salix purpurea]
MYEFNANTAAFTNEFAFDFKYDDNDAFVSISTLRNRYPITLLMKSYQISSRRTKSLNPFQRMNTRRFKVNSFSTTVWSKEAYRVSQSLSTDEYKEVQSELILHNCLLGRDDFISNPRASSREPLPPITIRTLEDLQTVEDRLGKNFRVVVPPNVPRVLRERTIE